MRPANTFSNIQLSTSVQNPIDFKEKGLIILISINFMEGGSLLRTSNEEARRAKKVEFMEKCFNCCAERGLYKTGIKAIAEACGCSVAIFYQYFDNLDDLLVKSTEYCMGKVEDEFMAKAPTDVEGLWRFIDEVPYWTAERHGKKYRLMYQVFTHPKYMEYGRRFFDGVTERYTEYAKSLEGKLGIPYQKLTPLIFILIRACVHYALFENEFYLKSQIEVLKETLGMFIEKYGSGESAEQKEEIL